MSIEILTRDDIDHLERKIDTIADKLSNLSENPAHVFYTRQQMLDKFNISARTLQSWRDEGIIAYSQIKGTIFYNLKDIQDMLERHKVEASR